LERGPPVARDLLRDAGHGHGARTDRLRPERLRALRPAALAAAAPLLAFAAAGLLGGLEGAEDLFRAGLGALVAAVLVFAFVPLGVRAFGLAAGGAALGVALAHVLAGAGVAGGLAAGALLFTQATAAAGFAALGRRVGAGILASGAVSAALLAVALQGLFWADDVAERLPAEGRWMFRQAVLDLDAATALAYDGTNFDRLGHGPIYAQVPRASSTHARPTAARASLVWGVFGFLAAGVASLGRARRPIVANP
jgi:hypothetical protein